MRNKLKGTLHTTTTFQIKKNIMMYMYCVGNESSFQYNYIMVIVKFNYIAFYCVTFS